MTRLYGPAPVRFLTRVYIDVFRSIPLLVLLIIVYYALPFVGISLSPFLSAMSALTLVSGAYTAEIFRAGIEAIPKGQFEASAALGLSGRQTMADVILPQAVRIVIPPLTNNSINVIKDTALASVVAMPDLLKQATQAQALAANPTPADRGSGDLCRASSGRWSRWSRGWNAALRHGGDEMTSFVSIRNLRKSYGTFEALQGIDLDIAEGEVVCVIGPSGSGQVDPDPLHQPCWRASSREQRDHASDGTPVYLGPGARQGAGRGRDGVPVLQPLSRI